MPRPQAAPGALPQRERRAREAEELDEKADDVPRDGDDVAGSRRRADLVRIAYQRVARELRTPRVDGGGGARRGQRDREPARHLETPHNEAPQVPHERDVRNNDLHRDQQGPGVEPRRHLDDAEELRRPPPRAASHAANAKMTPEKPSACCRAKDSSRVTKVSRSDSAQETRPASGTAQSVIARSRTVPADRSSAPLMAAVEATFMPKMQEAAVEERRRDDAVELAVSATVDALIVKRRVDAASRQRNWKTAAVMRTAQSRCGAEAELGRGGVEGAAHLQCSQGYKLARCFGSLADLWKCASGCDLIRFQPVIRHSAHKACSCFLVCYWR